MDGFTVAERGTFMTGRVATGSLVSGDTVGVPLTSARLSLAKLMVLNFPGGAGASRGRKMAGILVKEIGSKVVTRQGDLHTNCELEA
jgi:translation elongation factor EF-Tu-like GTPase